MAGSTAKRLTRHELVHFLNRLEERHDVNAMVHGPSHLWPLIRQKMGEHLIAHELAAPTHRMAAPRSIPQRAYDTLIGLRDLVSGGPRWEKTGLLFLSAGNHRIHWHGAEHDRFADPLITAAKELGLPCGMIEQNDGGANTASRAVPCPVYKAGSSMRLLAAVHWRRPLPDATKVPGLRNLLSEAASGGHVPDMDYLAVQLHTYDEYLRFYRPLIASLRPRCVFLVCWYALENMAVQHICREARIPVVDLQHGVQGPAHLAYGHWSRLPVGGYNTMPDRFWCWDKSSADNITSWCSPPAMRAYALGDPWAERSISLSHGSPWKDDGRIHVLYTAEPLPDLLPDLVLSAIRATRLTHQWLLRPHPAMPLLPGRLLEMLRAEGLANDVVISPPGEVLLAAALSGCDLHVTQYSSVVLEAMNAGVPSVSVHRTATDLFTDALAIGALHMVHTLDELLGHLGSPRPFLTGQQEKAPLAQRLQAILSDRLP